MTDSRKDDAPDMPLWAVEALCSRLCHDIISPASAVGHGVEILRSEGADGEAVALVESSAQRTLQRLTLQRVAYGSMGRRSSVSVGDALEAFEGFLDGRIVFERLEVVEPTGDESVRGHWLKLLVNTGLLAAELVRGRGTIVLSANPDRIRIDISGRSAELPEDIVAALTTDLAAESITPGNVQAFLCRVLSQAAGARLDAMEKESGSVMLSVDL